MLSKKVLRTKEVQDLYILLTPTYVLWKCFSIQQLYHKRKKTAVCC